MSETMKKKVNSHLIVVMLRLDVEQIFFDIARKASSQNPWFEISLFTFFLEES